MLDSDVIIDYIRAMMRSKPDALCRRIDTEIKKNNICSSSISASEIRFGAVKKGCPDEADIFLSFFNVLDYGTVASCHYSEIRSLLESQGNGIGAVDFFIAAHARASGSTLVSGNVREFKRVPDLSIIKREDFI